MKKIIFIFLLLSFSVFSQTKELYDLAFSNKENFKVLNIFEAKIPEKFMIIDSLATWAPEQFYLENIDLKNPKVIEEINKEEHHYYHSIYIFSDHLLDSLISDKEKIELSKKARLTSSSKIELSGKNYKTIKSFDKKGFYFLITEPLYTSDNHFAFIRINAWQKAIFLGEDTNEFFATFTITFQKNKNDKWEQVGIKEHLIQ